MSGSKALVLEISPQLNLTSRQQQTQLGQDDAPQILLLVPSLNKCNPQEQMVVFHFLAIVLHLHPEEVFLSPEAKFTSCTAVSPPSAKERIIQIARHCCSARLHLSLLQDAYNHGNTDAESDSARIPLPAPKRSSRCRALRALCVRFPCHCHHACTLRLEDSTVRNCGRITRVATKCRALSALGDECDSRAAAAIQS